MNAASKKLNELKKISFKQIEENFTEDVLLYTENKMLKYKNDRVYNEEDKCLKDLLRVIHITEPLSLKYQETKILVPRVFAESHNPIPQHISVQCLVFHKLKKENIEELRNIAQEINYNKTDYDNIWVGKKQDLSDLKENDILYIMNRRIGGWDGALNRPVIELLCAGGHLSTIWNVTKGRFETLQPIELLQREFNEELGLNVSTEQFISVGGFHNALSNELVILNALFIDFKQLKDVIHFSKNNYQENIDGVYLGIFEEAMKLYNENPTNFAGGEKAKLSNFPSNDVLLKKIRNILEEIRNDNI